MLFVRMRPFAQENFSEVAVARLASLGRFLTAAIVVVAVAGTIAVAQQSQAPSQASNRSLEGDWVRTDLSGSGSFGGLSDKFQQASLTPAGATMFANGQQGPRGIAYTETRTHGVGDPYIVVDRPCGAGGPFGGGGLGINPDSNAIHIVLQKDEIIIAPERGGFRRVYMDGRSHPDLSRWTPTGSGHGVGHYENGVLVVDTVGLTPGQVPAHGWRTPETHLAERFEVSPDAKHLTIKYTWTDPQIYVKPHSYEYTFDRLPPGSYAFEDWCDASGPVERQSIVPPPQR
jgi:hypothetical protein